MTSLLTKNYPAAFRHINEDIVSIQNLAKTTPYSHEVNLISLPTDFPDPKTAYVTLQNLQNKLDQTANKVKNEITKIEQSNQDDKNLPVSLKALENSIQKCQIPTKICIEDMRLDHLYLAIRENDTEYARKLLNEDKNLIDHIDADEWGIIHYCTGKGSPETLKMLIEEFGADINQKTAYAYTPAQIAAKKDNIPCLIELIKLGADLEIENGSGMTPLDFLITEKHDLQTLINYNPDVDFHLIYQDEHLKMIGDKYSIELF